MAVSREGRMREESKERSEREGSEEEEEEEAEIAPARSIGKEEHINNPRL